MPVYLMFFLNDFCMFMQTVTYKSIKTNIHKTLLNKLIITANSIPNNIKKDKYISCKNKNDHSLMKDTDPDRNYWYLANNKAMNTISMTLIL